MGVGLGLRLLLDFASGFEVDLGDWGELGDLGVVVLDLAGVGDRTFAGVLGVRGVLGVGGSRLMK